MAEEFDLAKFDSVNASEEGSEMPLRNPKSNAVLPGVVFRVIGKDSQTYRALELEIQNRRVNKALNRSSKKVDMGEIESDSCELLANTIRGWKGVRLNGKDLSYSPENARMLMRDYPWIREQVDEFTADRSNFLGNSLASSSNSQSSPSA